MRSTYEAKSNVWKLFNQPWSALPLSADRRGRIFISVDMDRDVKVF